MATRLYLADIAQAVTPSASLGAWDQTSGIVTRALEATKTGAITSLQLTETSATLNFDVLIGRFVSGALDAQTVSGTLDACIAIAENLSSSDNFLHIHAYLMKSDGTLRGNLLVDFVDTGELSDSPSTSGHRLSSAQALTSQAATAGDRIVVEIGFQSQNTLSSAVRGQLYYGGISDTDLSSGGNGSLLPGWIEFSGTLVWLNQTLQVSQLAQESLTLPSASPSLQVSQEAMEALTLPSASPSLQTSQLVIEVLTFEIPGAGTFRKKSVIWAG